MAQELMPLEERQNKRDISNEGVLKAGRRPTEESDCLRIGERVRALRKNAHLTIRALAERCSLSANTLSLIENEHTSPSVQTLLSLARGLDVPISVFFSCDSPEKNVIYQRHGERSVYRFSTGRIENLGDKLLPLGAEPILVTLENRERAPKDINHAGREFIYCLEGRMDCVVAGRIYTLSKGDSLLFDAALSHHWENAGLAPSRLLALFCPMDARDQPIERHLR